MKSLQTRGRPAGEQPSRASWRRGRAAAGVLTATVVVGAALGGAGASTLPALAAVGDPITGTIWQDYDSDGI
uniref:hypothetical protein n=1 Tax=Jiangella endophytica TaxID=1623398 RepID=UPI0018E5332C